jgi:hypothetical protein
MKKLIIILTMAFGLTVLSAPFFEIQAQTKTVVKKKKGWSHRKKYAVIGGAAGAVTGAVVAKKHRVAGGLIGGAVGAGAGYIIGRHKDKKHPSTKRIYKTKRSY